MKIVVTGASGFLGSQLLNKLVSGGHDVLPISRNSIDPLTQIKVFSPDVVVHCAWVGGNNYKDVNHVSQITNVYDGMKLLKAINTLTTKPKFVGFGSFAEYGKIENIATEDDWEQPINMYGLSKLTFKNYSKSYCEAEGIPWSWIRPCYVYGPGDVQTRLIPSVIDKLEKREQVLLDSCSKIIDYIYVDDFVNFAYTIVTGSATGVYNLCSGQQYKLRTIITMIAQILDAEDLLSFKDDKTRKLTPDCICGSNLKIKKLNSFKELTSLQEGLLKTITHYKINK